MTHVSDMTVAGGGPDDVEDFLAMLHDHSSWLVPVQYVDLHATLEWEEPPPIVKQVRRHARAGQTRICRDLITRTTGASALTDRAPEFVPPAPEPELYVHLLVTRVRFRQLSIAALITDARAEAARRGARLLRTHCWAGDDGRLVRDYEELGFTATLEFEVLRSDGSFWPGRVLQTRVEPSATPN
ncbi:GNAT family N-acetyltransferase (plasmid) [Embleya sp. NBC_00888]|uniref:GNAT family N-acetyltransferase n=1 Tax=Embleya sp. NBC_00888 TaxID=2975960 RepID=UPI002F90BAB0|nr:GNAT family N-acetyltransferase [Embleya sp. NBC_00888]